MWLVIAAALFFTILARQRWRRPPPPGPVKVLPELRAAAVTSVSVQLKGQKPIRAQRTNDSWRLTEPVPYPAQASSIERLLLALEQLTPAAFLSAHEPGGSAKSDEEEGLLSPQASLSIQGPARIFQLDVGARTAPGDQLYVQVAGVAGVHVVDAALLKEIPRVQDDWRDRALIDFKGLAFDHIAVTNRFNSPNETKVIELQRDAGNHLWRIVNPPINRARADANRLGDLLGQLASLRVKQFVSDEPKAELEPFGLHQPRLELALARGTNTLAVLQFGKSPTNDPAAVYARRWGQNTIVTVPTNALGGWQDQVNAFRATNVLDLPVSIAAIEVYGQDHFWLQRQDAGHWRLLPQNLPADASACKDLLANLGRMAILEHLDALTDPELARCGLAAPPSRKFILKTASPWAGATNPVIAQLELGATNDDRVFVRAEANSVYAVKLHDIQRLPLLGFQMRERQIWNFSDQDITNVIVRCQGKVRRFVHTGKDRQSWALGPGAAGTINSLAVQETMHYLARLTATNWVAHGLRSRARYGLGAEEGRITLELNNGAKPVVELGGPTPANSLYGAVVLEGEPWVFEFPSWLAGWVETFLLPPP